MSGDDDTNAKAGKKSGRQKLRDCCQFFYNSNTGEVLGRTGESWDPAVLYVVYYGVLAGFFAICLIGFFMTIDDNAPTRQNMYSLLKENPGMGFRPKPIIESTLIRYSVNDSSSYEKYIKNLNETLRVYEPSVPRDNAIDCDGLSPEEKPKDKICLFPLSKLGDSCTYEKHYGYPEGKPCVLLKMNKVYNWSPVPFENGTEAWNATAKHLKDRIDPNYVGVSCDGVFDSDGDSIRNITYSPELGFSSTFFPYRNQPGYLAPVVMAQFDVVPGRLVMIWCRVWAKNIKQHRVDLQGSVHFELLVDIDHRTHV